MSANRRKAAFLDRDGVLNADHGYLHRAEDFDILPGVLPALRLLREKDHALVVVTNQSGIGRGFYTEDDYGKLRDHMRALFAAEGIAFAGIYHCPHHPEAALGRYRVACDCRKPGPGLLRRAAEDLALSYAADRRVPVVVCNVSNPYGPPDWQPRQGMFVQMAALGKLPFYVRGVGAEVVGIDDAADGMLRAGVRGRVGRCYLVGSPAVAASDDGAGAADSNMTTTADAVFPDLLRCVRTVCLGVPT